MSIVSKTNATRLTPWLCATTAPLFAFSCVSLDAQQPPWEGCRAASKIEYESAKSDFLLKPVSAPMQRLAIGGGHYWYCRLLYLGAAVRLTRSGALKASPRARDYLHPCLAVDRVNADLKEAKALLQELAS